MWRRVPAPAGFRGRLLITFLAISTVPLVLTALAFFTVLDRNVESETFAKLAFVRDAKRSELLQYLTFAAREARNLSGAHAVRYTIGDFYGFSYAFRQIDPSPERATEILRRAFGIDVSPEEEPRAADPEVLIRSALEYSNAHNRFHDAFAGFLESSEFDNLYLVNSDRRVVYSVGKDGYLGADLRVALAGTPIGRAVSEVLEPGSDRAIVFRDFERDPVTGEFAAYVATIVRFYQRVSGAIVFRLPAGALDRIVQSESGATGALYLLSSRHQILSATPGGPADLGEASRVAPEIFQDTGSGEIDRGLAEAPALSAWTTLDFLDVPWVLVAEVPTAIAYAKSEALERIVLIIAALSLPVLLGLAFYLSRSMTAPVETLTETAEAIAAGDLDRVMPTIDRPSELGRLTRSFRQMRDAVRDQLGLIGQKNAQLEEQVRLIAEKNAELEETDRLKDTFLANTSHELRTPLHGIIGISETLSAGAAGELAPAQRSQLQLITFSARRLSRLVDDLLDLYRIRQGRMRLDIHPVNVAGSVRNVLQLSEPLLRGEPVTLRVDIPQATPAVLADPVRFEQILYNLLGNAIKYTEQGEIRISAAPVGETVEVAVEDTGCGISPEDLERIFHPLEQGDGVDAARKSGGTGLGLTIARQLATIQHGAIVAASAVGRGSRFVLRLPAAEAQPATQDDAGYHETINSQERADPFADRPIATDAPLIVVVDDEPINIQVLRNVLLPQGYVVRSADSGPAALQLIERAKPDLVVLDVMMPGMSGLEVAARLRDRYGLLELPIVMVTARSRTRDVIAGFEAGANDYVVKPFVKDELLARIATLLEAGRARGRARENTELRGEIERRVQVEDALRLSQRRLASLLDTVSAGLVCVNDGGTVTYVNRAAARRIGRPVEPGATPAADLLPPSIVEAMMRLCRAEGEVRLDSVRISGSATGTPVHAFELEPDAGGGIAIVMTVDEAEEGAERLVRSVRGAIDSVGLSFPVATAEAGPAAESAPPVAVPPAEGADRDLYRHVVVEVVTLSLALWRRATGTSKVELAEQSGVWRVNLDRSSLQTRTLDKYLLIETLPLHPRWRDVVHTAEFVLAASEPRAAADPATGAAREELRQRLALLRDILRDGIVPRVIARAPAPDKPDAEAPRMPLSVVPGPR